ncbi:MAG: RnfABCDGE type electron transport complex subunit D, partial [Clostridia bacterium]|nr:RnfABCDGE type electron transport complex subunit D [Clostridia bacterium]
LMSITVIILAYLYPRLAIVSDTIAVRYAFSHVFSGNLLFCGIFMQLYPASVPITRRAQLVCGVLGGVIVFLTRYYVAPNVGAICAMMIISLVARPLDYLLKPSVFGGKVKNEKKSSREIEK